MTAQDLKNSILQLAVQGKLVPQCKEDEPASELLKHILAEKEKLGIKEKPLSGITEEEIPFDIPDSWEWVKLGKICRISTGKKDANFGNENGKYYFFTCAKEPIRCNSFSFEGESILIAGNGDISNISYYDGQYEAYQRTYILQPYIEHSYLYYLLFHIQSNWVKYNIDKMFGSAIPYIRLGNVQNYMVALPPLAEQKRIVAKIEELMPLVEEYGKAEEQLTKLNAEFPDKFRKSILQQAVQGKLTERDPADEPAYELLKRIKAEKEALIKSGKIKKEKPLPEITEDEKPFDIPDTWEWIRLGDIVRYQGGYAYKSDTYVGCSNNQIIRLGNVKNNKLLLDSAPVFVSDHIACETEEYRIIPNTILFTMTGTKGKRDYFYTCCTTENNMGSNSLYLNQRVGCLKADGDICLEWLVIFLQSETVLSQIFATATGNVNQANIGSNSTLNLVLPLPPLAEQKRIVKRVEELLALCDELK